MNENDVNPYASPTEGKVAHATSDTASERADQNIPFREVFFRWEQLRIVYNLAVIGMIVLAGMAFQPREITDSSFIGTMVLWIITANAAYSIGATLNNYATWLGLRGIWVTLVLFLLIAALSVYLITMGILSYQRWF